MHLLGVKSTSPTLTLGALFPGDSDGSLGPVGNQRH